MARGKIWPLIFADFGTPTEKCCPSLAYRIGKSTDNKFVGPRVEHKRQMVQEAEDFKLTSCSSKHSSGRAERCRLE